MRKRIALILTFVMVLMMLGTTTFADAHVDEFPLLAGQDMEVGTVEVSNDGEFIYVKYVLNDDAIDDGWCITETHTHVGLDKADFPLNKGGNPKIGHFDFNMTHEPCVKEYEVVIPMEDFEPGDDILIAAHAVVQRSECIINAEAPYGGSSIVEAVQGLRYDYTAVKAARSVPENALLYESGHSENYFYSLGFMEDRDGYLDTSWIIIEFDDPIINGDGNDLQVVEDTWGLPYPVEAAEVFASNDGLTWESLGFADNQTPLNAYHTESFFELPDEWESARFVKVQDVSMRSDFLSKYPAQAATLDGFDLNAVLALHDNKTCETYSETAWGEGTRFVERGSWAMYFEYTINAGRELVDTVRVPSSGLVVNSLALTAGQEYELKASGTFTYNNAGDWADAEWYLKNGEIVKGDTQGSVPYVLDVIVNGDPLNKDWGPYNPLHIYTMEYTSTGGVLNFFIHDSVYSDNNGYITVEVYKIW